MLYDGSSNKILICQNSNNGVLYTMYINGHVLLYYIKDGWI